MIMLLAVMLVQVIDIVEPPVRAELTREMLFLLMLMVLSPFVELLLKEKNGLMLNAELAMMEMMSFVQMLLESLKKPRRLVRIAMSPRNRLPKMTRF